MEKYWWCWAHAEYLDGNKIYSGLVLFNPELLISELAYKIACAEEFTQGLGPTSGVETRYFYDVNGDYLPVASKMGKVLYSRQIGSLNPDIDPASDAEIKRYENVFVEEDKNNGFYLSNAYPNPFNLSTRIDYNIKENCNVNIIVYDMLGRRVKTLESGSKNPGNYSVIWNGKNENNEKVGSGVYFYDVNAGDFGDSKKVLMIK